MDLTRQQAAERQRVIDPATVAPLLGGSKKLQQLAAKLSTQMRADGMTQYDIGGVTHTIPTVREIQSASFRASQQRDFLKIGQRLISTKPAHIKHRYSSFDTEIRLISGSRRGKPGRSEIARRAGITGLSQGGEIEEKTPEPTIFSAIDVAGGVTPRSSRSSERSLLASGLVGAERFEQVNTPLSSRGSSRTQSVTSIGNDPFAESSNPILDPSLRDFTIAGISIHEIICTQSSFVPPSTELKDRIKDIPDSAGVDYDELKVDLAAFSLTGSEAANRKELVQTILRTFGGDNIGDKTILSLLSLRTEITETTEQKQVIGGLGSMVEATSINDHALGENLPESTDNVQGMGASRNLSESKYDDTDDRGNPVVVRWENETEQEPTKTLPKLPNADRHAYGLIYGDGYNDSTPLGNVGGNVDQIEESKSHSSTFADLVERERVSNIEQDIDVEEVSQRMGHVEDLLQDPRVAAAAEKTAEFFKNEAKRRISRRLGGEVPKEAQGVLDDMKGILSSGERDRQNGGYSEGPGGTGELPLQNRASGRSGIDYNGDGSLSQKERDEAKYNAALSYIQRYNPLAAGKLGGSTKVRRSKPIPVSMKKSRNQVNLVRQSVAGAQAYRDVFQTTFG